MKTVRSNKFSILILTASFLFSGCVCNRVKVVDFDTNEPIANAIVLGQKNAIFLPVFNQKYVDTTDRNGNFSTYSLYSATFYVCVEGYFVSAKQAINNDEYLTAHGLKWSDFFTKKVVPIESGAGKIHITEENPDRLGEIERLSHTYALRKNPQAPQNNTSTDKNLPPKKRLKNCAKTLAKTQCSSIDKDIAKKAEISLRLLKTFLEE